MPEMMKGCELCGNPARMFCDSDQASLCWDCDEKVHAANFLVAKHSRTLLCHVCQSATPWSAAGPNLGRTVSVCHDCAHRGAASASRGNEEADQESESDDGEFYTETDGFSEDEEEEEEEEEEDGENQVVPWSASASNAPPPPPPSMAASSSGCTENGSSSSSKRTWENYSDSEDEDGGCSSENLNSDENYNCSLSLLRPLKMRRRGSESAVIPSEAAVGEEARRLSGTAAIVEQLRRFETEEGDRSEMILGLCKLTGD